MPSGGRAQGAIPVARFWNSAVSSTPSQGIKSSTSVGWMTPATPDGRVPGKPDTRWPVAWPGVARRRRGQVDRTFLEAVKPLLWLVSPKASHQGSIKKTSEVMVLRKQTKPLFDPRKQAFHTRRRSSCLLFDHHPLSQRPSASPVLMRTTCITRKGSPTFVPALLQSDKVIQYDPMNLKTPSRSHKSKCAETRASNHQTCLQKGPQIQC